MEVSPGRTIVRAPFDADACSICGGSGMVPNVELNKRRHHYMQSVLCVCVNPPPTLPTALSPFYNGVRSGKKRSYRAHLLQTLMGVAPEQDPTYGKE